jgi:hypothetical protein
MTHEQSRMATLLILDGWKEDGEKDGSVIMSMGGKRMFIKPNGDVMPGIIRHEVPCLRT